MGQFCHSCGIPLDMPDIKVMAEKFCHHCTDDEGNVKNREDIQKGLVSWLRSWLPDLSEEEAMKRAEHYMHAMPKWAE